MRDGVYTGVGEAHRGWWSWWLALGGGGGGGWWVVVSAVAAAWVTIDLVGGEVWSALLLTDAHLS